jgi:hypothetical protein
MRATTLYSRLRLVHHQTATILQEALAPKSPNLALVAIARLEKQIELEAKLIGELDESVKVAVGVTVKDPEPQVDILSDEALAFLTYDEQETFIRLCVKIRERTQRWVHRPTWLPSSAKARSATPVRTSTHWVWCFAKWLRVSETERRWISQCILRT